MRLVFALTTFLFGFFPFADFREYHYNRPQLPFNTGISAQHGVVQHQQQQQHQYQHQPQAQPQVAGHHNVPTAPTTIVHHYGLNTATPNTNRHLSTSSSSTLQGVNGYSVAPQYQTSGWSQLSYNQAGADNTAASYYSQPPLQQQQQQQQQQQHNYQHYTTSNSNPLIQYGNLPQTGQLAQNYANGQQQFGTSSNAGFGIATASAGQGGIGNGNYVSQSESGQLHSYRHQQQPTGNTRPYTRVVTNCYPNGQCERLTLGPGEPDRQHQINAASTRARTATVSDKCRRIAEAAAAPYDSGSYNSVYANGNSQGYPQVHSNSIEYINLVRPKNRRLYEFTSVEIPKDPYN